MWQGWCVSAWQSCCPAWAMADLRPANSGRGRLPHGLRASGSKRQAIPGKRESPACPAAPALQWLGGLQPFSGPGVPCDNAACQGEAHKDASTPASSPVPLHRRRRRSLQAAAQLPTPCAAESAWRSKPCRVAEQKQLGLAWRSGTTGTASCAPFGRCAPGGGVGGRAAGSRQWPKDKAGAELVRPALQHHSRPVMQVLLARGFQFCDDGEPEAPAFPLPPLQARWGGGSSAAAPLPASARRARAAGAAAGGAAFSTCICAIHRLLPCQTAAWCCLFVMGCRCRRRQSR